MGALDDLYIDSEQDADLSTVGGRIEWARRRQAMTQEDLSKAMPSDRRKSRASIALYESGSAVSLEVLRDLAEILHESPSFLAFGDRTDEGSPPARGDRVPVNPSDLEPNTAEYLIMPRALLQEFDAARKDLALVRLDADAPSFGVKARDYVLLERGLTVEADGRLYAVRTSAGIALVRAEPDLTQGDLDFLHLTSGSGASYNVARGSLEVVGRLIASLQRQ